MSALEDYIKSLGGLHDCRVLSWQANFAQREIRLEIDNLFANFEGLPEDPGAAPASLFLKGVLQSSSSLEWGQPLAISDMIVKEEIDKISVDIRFWSCPGELVVLCTAIVVESRGKPLWPKIIV